MDGLFQNFLFLLRFAVSESDLLSGANQTSRVDILCIFLKQAGPNKQVGWGKKLKIYPQYLADQLTLFQPGRADYLLLPSPSVFDLPASLQTLQKQQLF